MLSTGFFTLKEQSDKGLTIETVLSTGFFTLKEQSDKGLTIETVLSTGYFTLKEWNRQRVNNGNSAKHWILYP